MNSIANNVPTFETEREPDGNDCWFYTVTATHNGLSACGIGYSAERAKERATVNLAIKQSKQILPTSPNWENSPESNLSKQSMREILCHPLPDVR